jgi:serine/threonine protein kinase
VCVCVWLHVQVTICCQVQHENLVNFYGYTSSPQLRICMEFVPGGALDSALYKDSSVAGRRWVPTHAQVKEMALGIAKGMAHLHGAGVIHRDLKSPNLLLNSVREEASSNKSASPRCWLAGWPVLRALSKRKMG